jgi:3'-phosphoadenosine 5'-phosphosulfate sulfotransferase (PAPS reductase)/FAD synthetase
MESCNLNPSGKPWLENADFLLGLKLNGLLVECPKCKSVGFPMRKYVKGGKKNPISVIHRNGSKSLKLCSLNKDESDLVRKLVSITKRDMEKIIRSSSPYVLFSGGKDSICTLIYVKRIAENVGKKIKAVHVDTTVGLPESSKHAEEICREFDVELKIVHPKKDFFSLAKEWGIPSHKFRWCCRELKIKPLANYLKTVSEPKIVLDGIRAAESPLRSSYLPVWYHPTFRCLSVSPIFYWSDSDVRHYLRESGLSTEIVNQLSTSPECWCGAYKSRKDFERLYTLSPELFGKLARLERNSKTEFTFIYENGAKFTLDSLKNEIEQTKNQSALQ